MSAADLDELLAAARLGYANSHCPYSGHRVGAAIRVADGEIFTGCNVENSSFGATTCAERVAVQKAVSEIGPRLEMTDVLVVTDATPPWPPCGICRQVLMEFARPGLRVHLANLSSVQSSLNFEDLVPHGFSPAHLGK